MGYELIWGRQWLPHTWKPHVITVVHLWHLLNSPVLNSMINSCKQYCLCDNVYSYLIFVLYFAMSWSKCWHCVITRKWIKIWLMTKKANDCGCNNLFIYSSRYYWIRSNLQFWVIKVFWRKATFLPVTFTLSSRNVVIQIQLNWTEAKV